LTLWYVLIQPLPKLLDNGFQFINLIKICRNRNLKIIIWLCFQLTILKISRARKQLAYKNKIKIFSGEMMFSQNLRSFLRSTGRQSEMRRGLSRMIWKWI
jgi:hypothetical protein